MKAGRALVTPVLMDQWESMASPGAYIVRLLKGWLNQGFQAVADDLKRSVESTGR